jgi:hypothetical protein
MAFSNFAVTAAVSMSAMSFAKAGAAKALTRLEKSNSEKILGIGEPSL